MENKGEFLTIAKMKPIIEKDQLPDRNELRKNPDQKLPDLNKLTNKFLCVCTTNEAEKNDAEENYNKINLKFKNRCKKEGKKVAIECVEIYPCFLFTNEPWIIKTFKEKPVKSGRKRGDTRIGRELYTSLVDALKEKGFSENMAFRLLEENLLVEYRWGRRLYDDTKKNLINEPFAVSSIPKSIDEHDLVQYTFVFLNPDVRIGFEEAKAIMAQMG